jgi:DNA primase
LKEAIPFVSAISQQTQSLQSQQTEGKQVYKRGRQEQTEEEQEQRVQAPSRNAANIREDNMDILSAVKEVYPQINETLEAVLLDSSLKTLLKIPVSDLVKKLNSTEGAKMLVLDGIVTQRLLEAADKAGIEYIIGHRMGDLKKSTDIRVRTFGDMGISN